jgi:hypothetical protein
MKPGILFFIGCLTFLRINYEIIFKAGYNFPNRLTIIWVFLENIYKGEVELAYKPNYKLKILERFV